MAAVQYERAGRTGRLAAARSEMERRARTRAPTAVAADGRRVGGSAC